MNYCEAGRIGRNPDRRWVKTDRPWVLDGQQRM